MRVKFLTLLKINMIVINLGVGAWWALYALILYEKNFIPLDGRFALFLFGIISVFFGIITPFGGRKVLVGASIWVSILGVNVVYNYFFTDVRDLGVLAFLFSGVLSTMYMLLFDDVFFPRYKFSQDTSTSNAHHRHKKGAHRVRSSKKGQTASSNSIKKLQKPRSSSESVKTLSIFDTSNMDTQTARDIYEAMRKRYNVH